MSFKKILVAINDSPLSSSVFKVALELSVSNHAALRLVHCVKAQAVSEPIVPTMPLDPAMSTTLMPSDFQIQQTLIERQMEESRTMLEHYRQEAASQGVCVDVDSQVGEAGHQLCELAQDWGADLVVVGRRGRTGLAEVLLGSVSNYVVHHAPCSVLVIQDVEPELSASLGPDLSSVQINPPPIQKLD